MTFISRAGNRILKDRSEAYDLLSELGATNRLVLHAHLVGQAADPLVLRLQALGVSCDVRLTEIGAVLHDVGKVRHPQELSEPGSPHEQARSKPSPDISGFSTNANPEEMPQRSKTIFSLSLFKKAKLKPSSYVSLRTTAAHGRSLSVSFSSSA
jgi:hypothetical protein